MNKLFSKVDKFFKITERGSSIKKEIMGGMIIFLSMAYILIVNPNMLSGRDAGVEAVMKVSWGAVFMATALSAGITTILMGLLANLPVGLAPGMGINAFFTYNVVLGMNFSYAQGLAIVFLAGLLFLAISVTGLRKKAITAIPASLKFAIGAGIGFFIGFIGLQNGGIIVKDNATMVALGDFGDPKVLLAIIGIVILIVLFFLKVKGFMIISLIVTMLIGLMFSLISKHTSWDPMMWVADPANPGNMIQVIDPFALPTFPGWSNIFSAGSWEDMEQVAGQLFKEIPSVLSTMSGWIAIFVFLFVDFFDTAGTFVAVGQQTGTIKNDGSIDGGERALMVDAIGTMGGSILGTSTVTSFIESGTGISAGARTGLAACTTGFMFLISIFILPIFAMFTGAVTALALVGVGMMMIDQLSEIDWKDKVTTFVAFITIITMVLTYAIHWGIVFGFITYAIAMLASKRYKEVPTATWVMAGISLLFVIFEFTLVR